MVVLAMIATGMPVFSENAKATGGDTDSVPGYLVIMRTPYDQDGSEAPVINKTIGNANQDDKFGVVVVAHVKSYHYDPYEEDIVKLSITGIGVKGENAGDYKIKWLEIGATKFSFEERGYEVTPRATDYASSITSCGEPNVVVGLRGSVYHPEIDWFREIAGDVAARATAAAINVGTEGSAAPLAGLAGEGVKYLVKEGINSMLNMNNAGKNYPGSDTNPWARSTDNPYTYMALRGVTDGGADDPDKVLLAKAFRWNLHDGINNRIHVLTLRATLCYAKYGLYAIGYGWHDERTVSTTVTIYAVPQTMVREAGTRGRGVCDLRVDKSDPVDPAYYLQVIRREGGRYGYSMLPEGQPLTRRGDTGPRNPAVLVPGTVDDRDSTDDYWPYYRGSLPIGDAVDKYEVSFIYDGDYSSSTARVWVFASGDVEVTIRCDDDLNDAVTRCVRRVIRGGMSRMLLSYEMSADAYATIEIKKLNPDASVNYLILVYTEYSDYHGEGGGSDGGHPPSPNPPYPIPKVYDNRPTAEQTY